MIDTSFLSWLYNETIAVQCSLLKALEEKDYMIYIEKSELTRKYMDKIGHYEETVIETELDVSLLEEKNKQIQISINRKEEIDIEKINRELEEIKEKKLTELNALYSQPSDPATSNINEEELSELKELYNEIVKNFHPELHSDLSDNQKALYDKALRCYQQKKLEELRIVHAMLMNTKSLGLSIDIPLTVAVSVKAADNEQKVKDAVAELKENYTLAQVVYDSFEKTEDEITLENKKRSYQKQQDLVFAEIHNLMKQFPFTAKETLNDENKTNAYLESLKQRELIAINKKNELLEEIKRKLDKERK